MWQILLILFITCIGVEIDPYKILNIPHSASQKRIKSAYKKLALKYHPDKNKGDPKNDDRFAKIGAAYELLKNPKRKKEFDKKRRRQERNPFFNRWQQARSEDGGLGAVLTRYNYDTLVKKSGKTWLIVVYSSWNCRTCDKAKALFEEVCDQWNGLIKCGKINRDKDYQWVANGLQIRRIPILIAYRGSKREFLSFHAGRTLAQHVKNAVDKLYPKRSITEISTEKGLRRFLTMDIHSTRALIFSVKTRVPHALMRHAAAEFPNVQFGFVHSSNKNTMRKLRDLMHILSEGSVLLIVNAVLPFSENAQHSEIDLGIYKRDVRGLLSAIKERAEPDLPLLSFSNFVDMCYNTDGEFDTNVRCFLYLFENSIPEPVKQLITRLQSAEGVLRTAAVDCKLQKKFCSKMGYKSKPTFIGIAAHNNKFVPYPHADDLSQFESWASTVTNSLETCATKSGVGFPEEQIDSFTRARRKLNEGMKPILNVANIFGSLGSSAASQVYWVIETFVSVLFSLFLPMLLFSSLFFQRGR